MEKENTPRFLVPDSISSSSFSPSSSLRSREYEGLSIWTEYLGSEAHSPMEFVNYTSKGASQKGFNLQLVVHLSQEAEGLLVKMYHLIQILDHPDPMAHAFSEGFWKAGVFPNFPRICLLLSKKFPEHFSKLQLERVDKVSLDALNEGAADHVLSLEPWMQLLHDLMAFREQTLHLILDLATTLITLSPRQNSVILHAFMDLFCSFVRVNLLSQKIPRKMILQVYNLLHAMLSNDRDCNLYHRLVQFIDAYDRPLKGLQEDLDFVSPRIGEVLEAVGPIISLFMDTIKLRNEGFLSPYHPRHPDIIANLDNAMRTRDLADISSYMEWILYGYLVCPDELLHATSIDIALSVLKENLIITLFRDECLMLHEDYQLHVLPRVLESKKLAKSGRMKIKDVDMEYNVAKQVEKMLSEVHDQALVSCAAIHHVRRIFLKQEIARLVLFFTDQPSLLAPNIQLIFSALALAHFEVVWYFQHVGFMSSKYKSTRIVPLEIDPTDQTLGYLLGGMGRLCSLVRKYNEAIRGYAVSCLSSCATRIQYLLESPAIVALGLDGNLKGGFQQIIKHFESLPQMQDGNFFSISCKLSEFRKDWMSILMIVTSSWSSVNINQLEKASVSTGKEGLLSEGNTAFIWSRYVDELESLLSKHGTLKQLYFYHHHLMKVFGNTMFSVDGCPQHCCSWLSVAASFPECASPIIPEEVTKIARDTVLCIETIIESIIAGLEGLINILDSDGGFGALEAQLLPEQAAVYLNNATPVLVGSTKSLKGVGGFSFPGHESFNENNVSTNMLEAAMERVTSLCAIMNDMEPIYVLNHVFILREYMRECFLGNFKRRLLAVLKTDNDLQRPSVLESLIRRHMRIVHVAEQHINMDLTNGIRQVLLTEAFSGPDSSLQMFEKPLGQQLSGSCIEIVCNWYVENIVKDITGAGILFTPTHKCFKSTKPVGGYFAEYVTGLTEFRAFVCVFGGYGVDRVHRMMKDHMAALLNCIKTSLQSNQQVLAMFPSSVCSGDQGEREACLRQIVGMDTVLGFCTEVGHALAFLQLLAEAAGNMLEEGAPLLYSLLSGAIKHIPVDIPQKREIKRVQAVANIVALAGDHDSVWMKSVLEEVISPDDDSWSLLPFLFSSFMVSNIWNTTAFNVDTGGFNNNIHSLARCINALITVSEFVKLEHEHQQTHLLSNCNLVEAPTSEAKLHRQISPEVNIKSSMQLFVKSAAEIVLDSFIESNRAQAQAHLVAKLIFLDQLCEISPYLSRSTLEAHIPYAILRSLYSRYFSNSPGMPLACMSDSPVYSPTFSLARASPFHQRPSCRDSTLQLGINDSVSSKSSSRCQEQLPAADGRSQPDYKRNLRNSGPLDHGSAHKAKVGISTTWTTSHSLLPRFSLSRSNTVLYK